MNNSFDILFENTNSSEKIVENIRNGKWNDILCGLCFIYENQIVLNYKYFKYFATKETYDFILNYITINIDNVLNSNNEFIVHVNMKDLTITEIDKHMTFIQNISGYLKEKYPKKLSKCYIYNAPFVFTQIYNIVSMFIDKDTQKKIELVKRT